MLKNILVAIVVLLTTSLSYAQIKNSKTETVKIYGNCGTCEKKIEKAGNIKGIASVDWNKDSKMAVLVYDASKTNKDEILKRIALAGYDSDDFLAPADAYTKLDACCQYDRTAKVSIKTDGAKMAMNDKMPMQDMPNMSTEKADASKIVMTDAKPMHDMSTMTPTKDANVKMVSKDTLPMNNMPSMSTEKADKTKMVMADTVIPVVSTAAINPFKSVFENYFLLKDALIQTSGSGSAEAAKNLSASLNAIKMDELPMDVHTVWMKVMKDLMFDAEHISETQAVAHQREHFASLSKNMYALMKVSKSETETYYQFCPMYNKGKGANWLSKDSEIKNPYYGSQMLSCGRTQETIK